MEPEVEESSRDGLGHSEKDEIRASVTKGLRCLNQAYFCLENGYDDMLLEALQALPAIYKELLEELKHIDKPMQSGAAVKTTTRP